MNGWSIQEDVERHARWHNNATWFDVLTSPISVDRSSVGNALYLVLNMACSSSGSNISNVCNVANLSEWAKNVKEAQSKLTRSRSQSLGRQKTTKGIF